MDALTGPGAAGEIAAGVRLWSAAVPPTLVVTFLVGAVAVYALRARRDGPFRDDEVEARGQGGLTTRRTRRFFAWLMRPLWTTLVATGVPPNAVSTLSLLLSLAAGVAIAAGHFALGGWLYVGGGALDFLDGRVARETGRATKSGAALDSVLDRYGEGAVLVGLGWYYRDTWVLIFCLLALTGSLIVPYIRARGESLGAKLSDVGLMQRPERVLCLGLSVALSPLAELAAADVGARPMHWLAVGGLVLLAVMSHLTAIQRFARLLVVLDGAAAPPRKTLSQLSRLGTASLVATGADFFAVYLLVQHGVVSPAIATALGCALGGVVNFSMNRAWTFQATTAPFGGQGARYVLVSASSALLNAGGVAVLLLLPGLDYRVAWLLVRLTIFLTWNMPLFRDYVFATAPRPLQSRPRRHVA